MMTYLFDDFKAIKTFPASTRVYRNGVFMPDLSEESDDLGLPLHIIHIGTLSGDYNWFIDINEKRDIFLTAKIETRGATNIRCEINLNQENIRCEAKLIIKNTGNLNFFVAGNNNKSSTNISVQTKLFAGKDSENIMVGEASVPSNSDNVESDIGFSALCDSMVKSLKISPNQIISNGTAVAKHSASIYRPAKAHIKYLETSGLSEQEAVALLNKVFMEEE